MDVSTDTAGTGPNWPVPQCNWFKHAFIYRRPEHFVHVWPWTGAPATVQETVNSSHSLGVGLEIGSGPWQASGSVDKTTEMGTGAGTTYKGNWTVGNYVNYRHFPKACQDVPKHYYVRPVSYFALLPDAVKAAINPLNFTTCVGYSPAST